MTWIGPDRTRCAATGRRAGSSDRASVVRSAAAAGRRARDRSPRHSAGGDGGGSTAVASGGGSRRGPARERRDRAGKGARMILVMIRAAGLIVAAPWCGIVIFAGPARAHRIAMPYAVRAPASTRRRARPRGSALRNSSEREAAERDSTRALQPRRDARRRRRNAALGRARCHAPAARLAPANGSTPCAEVRRGYGRHAMPTRIPLASLAPPRRIRPAQRRGPFFEDKARAFWTLQAVGWGGYLIVRERGVDLERAVVRHRRAGDRRGDPGLLHHAAALDALRPLPPPAARRRASSLTVATLVGGDPALRVSRRLRVLADQPQDRRAGRSA